jgi:hypothetical protein
MTFSVFCLSGLAHALPASKTQRVLKAYRKSYANQAARYMKTRDRANAVDDPIRALTYFGAPTERTSQLMDRIAGAESRDALIAEEKAKIEQDEQARAQRELDVPVRFLKRWRERTVAVADSASVQRRLDKFAEELDGVLATFKKLDTALGQLPPYLTRGLQLGAMFGNANLKNQDYFRLLRPLLTRYRTSYNNGLIRMELLLQTRITRQIEEERAETAKQDKQSTPEALRKTALQLIDDIRSGAGPEQKPTQGLTAVGSAQQRTASHEVEHHHGLLFTTTSDTRGKSAADSRWTETREQLIPGAEYTLRVSSAERPLVHETGSNWDKSKIEQHMLLPVEARLLLEKVVRVKEIRDELVDRESALADPLTHWLERTRFTMAAPSGQRDSEGRIGDFHWESRDTIQAITIKTDLGKLGDRDYFEPTRAAELDKQAKERLTNTLR